MCNIKENEKEREKKTLIFFPKYNKICNCNIFSIKRTISFSAENNFLCTVCMRMCV